MRRSFTVIVTDPRTITVQVFFPRALAAVLSHASHYLTPCICSFFMLSSNINMLTMVILLKQKLHFYYYHPFRYTTYFSRRISVMALAYGKFFELR